MCWRMGDSETYAGGDERIVAYEYQVKGPASGEWKTHYDPVAELPEDVEDAWRDDHRVRNIRPLVYVGCSSHTGGEDRD